MGGPDSTADKTSAVVANRKIKGGDWSAIETPLYAAEALACVLQEIDGVLFDDPGRGPQRLGIERHPDYQTYVMSEAQHLAFVYVVSTLIQSVREAVKVFEAVRGDTL